MIFVINCGMLHINNPVPKQQAAAKAPVSLLGCSLIIITSVFLIFLLLDYILEILGILLPEYEHMIRLFPRIIIFCMCLWIFCVFVYISECGSRGFHDI